MQISRSASERSVSSPVAQKDSVVHEHAPCQYFGSSFISHRVSVSTLHAIDEESLFHICNLSFNHLYFAPWVDPDPSSVFICSLHSSLVEYQDHLEPDGQQLASHMCMHSYLHAYGLEPIARRQFAIAELLAMPKST